MLKTTRLMLMLYGLSVGHTCAETIEYTRKHVNVSSVNDAICDYTGTTMTCAEIPETVPASVTCVVITRHLGTLADKFKGHGWDHVEQLQIYGNTTVMILDNHLTGLDNVMGLSFTFPHFVNFSKNAFAVTPKVTKLNLMGMAYLHTNTLLDALTQAGVLQNLAEIVFNPGYVNNPPAFTFTEQLTQELLERPITLLNFSNSIILGGGRTGLEIVMKVDVLNISGSYIIPTDSDLSMFHLDRLATTPLLKVIDISGTTSPFRSKLQHVINTSFMQSILFSIVHVHANHVVRKDYVISHSYNLTNEPVFLKTIFLRRNKIQRIEARYTFNLNNSFEVIDLSENNIEYMSPEFLSNALHLRSLLLSQNRLSAMEHSSDFRNLFSSYINLGVLFMDQNNISSIPWDMFVYNKNLEKLILADNRLTTIGFNLAPLTSLQMLDIRRNAIHFIEANNLVHLQIFVHKMTNKSVGSNFELMLQGNPFECICNSLEFIEWIQNYIFTNEITERSLYTCKYGGSTIEISDGAVHKCKFLCKRNLIIGLSTSGSVVVIALFSVVFCVSLKARKQRRKQRSQDDFERDFHLGLLKQTHLCFVAYASHDEETVRQVLVNPIGDILKQRLDTNKDMTATGYDFRPGFPIYEEAFRVVKESNVFLAVVSDAFCDSEYCLGEINEACTQQKPIIVVLLGRVTEKKMTPYLTEVFRRKARASIIQTDNGEFELIPNVHRLSESIMELAINAYERERE